MGKETALVIKKITHQMGARRISCRCSSTIVDIALSTSKVYHMLGTSAVMLLDAAVERAAFG